MKMTHNGKTITINDWSYSSKDDVLRVESDVVDVPDADPVPEDPKPVDPDIPVLIHGKGMKPEIKLRDGEIITYRLDKNGATYGLVGFSVDGTPGGYREVRRWFSATPGGPSVFKYGEKTSAGQLLTINWTSAPGSRQKAELVGDGPFYFNMAYVRKEGVVTTGTLQAQ